MTTQPGVRDAMSFMYDHTAECMPRAELAALQLERLEEVVGTRLHQGSALPR